VHRLAAASGVNSRANAWLERLWDIFGGCTQGLLLADDADGKTPLIIAVDGDAPEAVRSLLRAAEDSDAVLQQPISSKNHQAGGSLPLSLGMSKGFLDVCKSLMMLASKPQELLEMGNPFGGNAGTTALHAAAGPGLGNRLPHCQLALEKAEDAGRLLSLQARSNALACTGVTPLHLAAAGGFGDIVQLILQTATNSHALLQVKDSEGRTAFDLAKLKGQVALLAQLSST